MADNEGQRPAPSTRRRGSGEMQGRKNQRALTRELLEAAGEAGISLTPAAARVIVARASQAPRGADGWSHWLRNDLGILDPTGEAASSRADRGGPYG